jgi:hypothetical protein
MLRVAKFVALAMLVAACTKAPEAVELPQATLAEFEAFIGIDANGDVQLDGEPLERELESPENYARLRSAARRRVGHFDASDPTSCILSLVRVRLSVDSDARFGRVCSLLWSANQPGVTLWDLVVVAPGDSGQHLPLPLPACAFLHGPRLPWSPERRLTARLNASRKLQEHGVDPARGWRLENSDYGTPPDPQADLHWPTVQKLLSDARSQGRTTLLSRTVSSQAPWRDVLPLLEQLHEVGVDHYELWLAE